jgi:hypothetical protein
MTPRWAVADYDYQEEIPEGRTVEIIAEMPPDMSETDCATWLIRDCEGNEAVVPAGSLVELPELGS